MRTARAAFAAFAFAAAAVAGGGQTTGAGRAAPANGVCLAATFKDAAGARKTLEEIGPEVSRRGGESARRLPSGNTLWTGITDRTLLLSTSQGNIAAAGAVAIAEQALAPR